MKKENLGKAKDKRELKGRNSAEEPEILDLDLESEMPDEEETKGSEIQGPEIKKRKIKEPETKGPKTKEPETKEPKTKEPATKGPKTKGPETKGPETKEPETSKWEEMEEPEESEWDEESYAPDEIELGEDGEEWSGGNDWEDEEEPVKPWKTVLVFLALMGAAVVICTVLWQFSHREKPEGQETEEQWAGSPSSEENPDSADDDVLAAEPISGTKDMEFTSVKQSVTPRDVVNLRSVPSILDTDNIVAQAQNGEVFLRTGINEDTGWSEVEYGGKTLYAVTQYLTLDLEYKPSIDTSNPNRVVTIDGRIMLFADCDDWISPKEYVNLRTEPSTSEGNGTVSCQLNYGEKAHRTGISQDSGWSRVEYNDQVLYVVTSLIYEVEGDEADQDSEETNSDSQETSND